MNNLSRSAHNDKKEGYEKEKLSPPDQRQAVGKRPGKKRSPLTDVPRGKKNALGTGNALGGLPEKNTVRKETSLRLKACRGH